MRNLCIQGTQLKGYLIEDFDLDRIHERDFEQLGCLVEDFNGNRIRKKVQIFELSHIQAWYQLTIQNLTNTA